MKGMKDKPKEEKVKIVLHRSDEGQT